MQGLSSRYPPPSTDLLCRPVNRGLDEGGRGRFPIRHEPTLRLLSPSSREVGGGISEACFGEERETAYAHQEFLWQGFFRDPSQWWDNRRTKRTPRHPDFRHKKSKVALWLDNRYKPAWVDSQLAMLDTGTKGPPESLTASSQDDFGRLAAHKFVPELGRCGELCEHGQISDAVDGLDLLVQQGCHVPNNLFYRVLKRCKDLLLGRRVHALTIKGGYEGDAFLATHLIGLYASHGRLGEAMQVFANVPTPSAHNWATIIFAHARHGEPSQAIRLYNEMRQTTVKPDNHIFRAALTACATAGDLAAGKDVHAHVRASAGRLDVFVQTCLVDMYAKCGSIQDARTVFDTLPHRNVVTWTAMIAGYAQQGMGHEALNLYRSMQHEGITPPDSVTFVCLLRACANEGEVALREGKQLHSQIEERGLQDDVVVGASLVNMYAKCGTVETARKVFDRLPHRNVVTWNAMIAGYAQQGFGQEALTLYQSMQEKRNTPPDSATFVSMLQACASMGVGGLHQGKQLHSKIQDRVLQDDVAVGSSLVNMYAKCGSINDARRVFDMLPHRNVVTWTTMITAYGQEGMGQEALSLYMRMQQENIIPPDSVTFVCLLQACASVGELALHQGRQLHVHIGDQGLEDDVVVGGSLVNMYAKCGSIEDARRVFDGLSHKNVVSWTAMIASYAQQGMGEDALGLFCGMQQDGISPPDCVSYICLLQACASVGEVALQQGKELHAQIEKRGLHHDVAVGASLVNMYAKCGSLETAQSVFDSLPQKNVVTWNVIIAGYSQQEMAQQALSLYRNMQDGGITQPNSVTYASLLQACAAEVDLPLGKQLHAQIKEQGLQADVIVGPSLVNMYSKCGSLEDAQHVFESLVVRDVVAWSALIAGYSLKGDSEAVFNSLDRMLVEGVQPDQVTFLSVLTVCSHVGLVDEGRKYFKAMTTDHGITPTVEHYTCMTDLLGRAGYVHEALQVAKTMPVQANGAVWLTLLGACQKWGNVEVGRQAFECAVRIDENDAASYVLMSNIYAGAQLWDEAKEMQARRVKCRAWKQPGQSWWNDMGGVAYTFIVGDWKLDSLCIGLEQSEVISNCRETDTCRQQS